MLIKIDKLQLVHEDNRRLIFEAFNGNWTAKQLKVVQVKKDCILGNHYHEYSEMFCVFDGEAKFILQNIKTGKISEYNMIKQDILFIGPKIAHKVIAKSGTVILEGATKKYVSPEESDIKWELKI